MQGEVTKQVRHFRLFSPLAVGERRLNRGPEALRDIEPKIQYNPNSEKPKAMNNNQGETAHPLKNTWFSLKHIFMSIRHLIFLDVSHVTLINIARFTKAILNSLLNIAHINLYKYAINFNH